MELYEIIRDHKNFIDTGEIGDDKTLLKDLQAYIKELARDKQRLLHSLLSQIDLICDLYNDGIEYEHANMLTTILFELDNIYYEITDPCYGNNNMLEYFEDSLDEIYDMAISYKRYGFPNTLKEFVEDHSYLFNFVNSKKEGAEKYT